LRGADGSISETRMRRLILAMVLLATSLGGCVKHGMEDDETGAARHGRYLGVGVYPAGTLWQKLAVASPPKDAASAKLADDDQVIVVVDSATGEIRQCGNLSGYCIGLNPWTKTPAQVAPAGLTIHADQLAAQAAAQEAAAKSAPAAH
jgi:hypothetical protein